MKRSHWSNLWSNLWNNLTPKMLLAAALLTVLLAVPLACGGGDDSLTVYSGRSESLVDPLLEAFVVESGIEVSIKYAGSTAIASTILEEGDNTPADVVFLQDPGSLGSLSDAGLLAELPEGLLSRVPTAFRSPVGRWVGTSGRARTVVYNTATIDPKTDLPESILGFTSPEWRGRVGWAPGNGSFQAFVTAFRVKWGEEAAPGLAGRHQRQRTQVILQQHNHRRRRSSGRSRRWVRKSLLSATVPGRGRRRVRRPQPLPYRRRPWGFDAGSRRRNHQGCREP